jgi:hypothetical protein
VTLSVYAVFSAQEGLYISRYRGLYRLGVIVKIFEEPTRDPQMAATRNRAVSLIMQMHPQLFDSRVTFRLLHVTLLVKKGRIHKLNNRKDVACQDGRD